MSKQWLFNVATVALLVFGFIFWVYSYAKVKEELVNVKADNEALLAQMAAKDEAAQLRQEEYNKIEDAYNELNQQMEELKDEDSKNWLDSGIPPAVDSTIPY